MIHLGSKVCCLSLIAFLCSAVLRAQPSGKKKNGTTASWNGIFVGQPKLFDEQSLTLMLEALDASLRPLNGLDAQAISSSVGKFQGTRQRDSNFTLTLGNAPVPDVKSPATNSGGNAEQSETGKGKSGSDTSGSSDSSSNYQPSFGISPESLLAEQVNLSYQVFNLRMLLNRESDVQKDTRKRVKQIRVGAWHHRATKKSVKSTPCRPSESLLRRFFYDALDPPMHTGNCNWRQFTDRSLAS